MADEQLEDRADKVIPFFYLRPVKDNYRSKQEGRPIYEDREYVQMLIPGDDKEKPDVPVKEEHRERWPEQYQKFLRKQEQSVSGTPLEQWPVMTPSLVSSLKEMNVYTVEQLSELSDSGAKDFGPGIQELKKKAQDYLQTAGSENMVERLEELQERIRELEEENAELRKNQKKKPGRPKKSESQ